MDTIFSITSIILVHLSNIYQLASKFSWDFNIIVYENTIWMSNGVITSGNWGIQGSKLNKKDLFFPPSLTGFFLAFFIRRNSKILMSLKDYYICWGIEGLKSKFKDFEYLEVGSDLGWVDLPFTIFEEIILTKTM